MWETSQFWSKLLTTFYSTTKKYSRVCGQVICYQLGSPDGFNTGNESNIDGVDIILSASGHHIWSYVAVVTESSKAHSRSNCPCFADNQDVTRSPTSIDQNYYCKSGNPTLDFTNQLFSDDKLWDGQQCKCEGTCCIGMISPPWFSVQVQCTASNSNK